MPTVRFRIPRRLAHVQIIKRREGKRLVEVEIRYTHGSQKRAQQALDDLGYEKPNTSAIERRNATARRMICGHFMPFLTVGRHRLQWVSQTPLLAHAIGRPTGGKKYQQRSPAMAAGLADGASRAAAHHIFSIRELLLTPVYPARGGK